MSGLVAVLPRLWRSALRSASLALWRRLSDAPEPGPRLVQAAEQLDGPFTLGEVGKHVGKADAERVDDERHRAARYAVRRTTHQLGDLLHLLARHVGLAL